MFSWLNSWPRSSCAVSSSADCVPAVLARSEPKGGQPASVRPVAQLGEEEFFGELELLRGTPPLASVVALTPLTVLALPHAAVQAFILGDGRVAKGLEQVGTGRLIALRAGGAA